MESYSPSLLPSVTSVVVVDLRRIDANRVSQHIQNAAAAPSITLNGDYAQRIAELWRALPPGNQSRCHTPPFGLRFRLGERVVCEASLCWECDNIFGQSEGRDIHYEFDAGQPISKALLAELRRVIGDPDAAEPRAATDGEGG